MDKQVGKSAIFTKESLRNIQDKMREYCIISFNNIYGLNYTITSEEVNQIKDYIEHTKNTTSNLKNTNDLNVILEKYEDDMKKHKKEVELMQYKINNRDKKISDLEDELIDTNYQIDELEEKVSNLEKIVDYFKDLWKRLLEYFQEKFFSSNKYDSLIKELYLNDIFDKNDIEIIENKKSREKTDDFER